MKSFCIIPVKNLQGVKSRLSSILQPRDRGILNLCMLEDVIISVKASKSIYDIVVVSPDQEVIRAAGEMKVKTLRENREDGVNKAVLRATEFCIEEGANSSVILPSDIPLIKPLDIDNLLAIGDYGRSVVMTPSSKLDGTNALFRCPPMVMKTFFMNCLRNKGIGLGNYPTVMPSLRWWGF